MTSSRCAAGGRDRKQIAALTVCVFGGWLFYLTKLNLGVDLPEIDRDILVDEWAEALSGFLDMPV